MQAHQLIKKCLERRHPAIALSVRLRVTPMRLDHSFHREALKIASFTRGRILESEDNDRKHF